MTKNYVSIILTIILSVISTVSFADDLKLALNWKAEPQFGGFYAADFNGHYKKNNLSVKIIEGGSGTPTIQMITSGQVDYAIVSADEILISHDRKATDVIALFATYQTNPQGIMTHAEKNFKDLESVLKSEGVLLWQAGLPYAQYLTKKYGPLKIKTAPYLGGIGNFQKDPQVSQQCFVTSEPLTAKKADLKVKTFLVAESGYNPYTTVLVTKASRLKSHPEEVKKMVESIRQGWSDYLDKPESVNKRMSEINKAMALNDFNLSAKEQEKLIRPVDLAAKNLGVMTKERWESLTQQLLELKIIKKTVPADVVFTNL